MHQFLTRRAIFLAALALIPLTALACSNALNGPSSPSGPTPLSAGQLDGTWTLVSLQPSGAAPQAAPAGATYSLTLAADRASTRADCNTCGGALAVSGSTVTIGPLLACTRAACQTMDFETAYEAILAGEHSVALSGDTATLRSARGTLTFRR